MILSLTCVSAYEALTNGDVFLCFPHSAIEYFIEYYTHIYSITQPWCIVNLRDIVFQLKKILADERNSGTNYLRFIFIAKVFEQYYCILKEII